MTDSWDERVNSFWDSADDQRSEAMLTEMRALVEERGEGTPDALYEWASVHDFLGREVEAISIYRAALDRGLSGDRRSQAIVQLASSLRNAGEPVAAVALLQEEADNAVTGAAAQAFLALALRDAGRPDEALCVALKALAPTLPLYGRAIAAYADDLVADST
jgi:tetratricopeptide (TPR) repeat protein